MPDVQPAITNSGCDDVARARTSADFKAWFEQQRLRVDGALAEHLRAIKARGAAPGRLLEAIVYSVMLPGKRVRPILVLESCRAAGGDERVARPAAIAIECIHTFSLIHDDLPAMDNDELRRGQPTNHTVFGEAEAILAGDWLVPHAFEMLASNPVPVTLVPVLTQTLAAATQAMVLGQSADIAGEGQTPDKDKVRLIHGHKTAALLGAACRMGGVLAEASAATLTALTQYGRHLGLAFQIVDDLLDCTATTEAMGKRTQKDDTFAKQTYPAAFGVDASRIEASAQIEAAIAELAPLGAAAERLRQLAQFVIQRGR